MSFGPKAKREGRVTVLAEIAEDIRCDRAMLQTWQNRGDPVAHAKKREALELQLEAVRAKIAEIDEQHRQAPAKIEEYEKRIEKKRLSMVGETKRKQVVEVAKLVRQIEKLRADPEVAAALADMLAAQAGDGQA